MSKKGYVAESSIAAGEFKIKSPIFQDLQPLTTSEAKIVVTGEAPIDTAAVMAVLVDLTHQPKARVLRSTVNMFVDSVHNRVLWSTPMGRLNPSTNYDLIVTRVSRDGECEVIRRAIHGSSEVARGILDLFANIDQPDGAEILPAGVPFYANGGTSYSIDELYLAADLSNPSTYVHVLAKWEELSILQYWGGLFPGVPAGVYTLYVKDSAGISDSVILTFV